MWLEMEVELVQKNKIVFIFTTSSAPLFMKFNLITLASDIIAGF
jgi:hypothetical protein